MSEKKRRFNAGPSSATKAQRWTAVFLLYGQVQDNKSKAHLCEEKEIQPLKSSCTHKSEVGLVVGDAQHRGL